MPKEKTPQGGRPIRGDDNSTISQKNNSNNIPEVVIDKLEREIQGVVFGGVSLIINIRDRHLTYRIEKTISIDTNIRNEGDHSGK